MAINFTVRGQTKAHALAAAEVELAKPMDPAYEPMALLIRDSVESYIELLTDNPTMDVQVIVSGNLGILDGDPQVFTASIISVQAFYAGRE